MHYIFESINSLPVAFAATIYAFYLGFDIALIGFVYNAVKLIIKSYNK